MSDDKQIPDTAVDPTALEAQVEGNEVHVDEATGQIDLPPGWMYKKLHFFKNVTWYASPRFQLILVAFVCFMCPGMFNALGGLGGGGQASPTLADNMNTILYSFFAFFGIFGGTLVNWLGVKACLAFGGIGYAIYAGSLLSSLYRTNIHFSLFAGAWLGICAGLLWTAQGTIMISYPKEGQKGRFFAWFWGIFNMGAVIGSLIPLGTNFNNQAATVNAGTYIGFIVLMLVGAALALCLCNAKHIIRPDGSKVVVMKHPTLVSELYGLYETLKFEPFIVLLFPMFFVSNWFYAYQQNSVNAARFDIRSRALNGLLYWLAQIIAAIIWGSMLDIGKIRRSTRGKITWGVLFVLTFVIWGAGYAFEKTYTRTSDPHQFDWDEGSAYVGPMFLYFFYGFYDAAWQASVYWFMGALSNSGRRSANFVGLYKGVQSAGAAVVWNLDARQLSYKGEYISNFALLGAALVFSFPVVFMKIKDHVTVEEDIANTDETVADVLPAGHEEKTVS